MSSPAPLPPAVRPTVLKTGIPGLDIILGGGFTSGEMHLVQGVAGTGKTTMALGFLREGAQLGESTLYVTLSQPKEHLERIARSHGWDLEGVTVQEIAPGTVANRLSHRQSVLATVDVELQELFEEIVAAVTRVQPKRAVVDSITIIQSLAAPLRYHREIVTLRQLFVEQGCTTLFLADHPAEMEQGSAPEVQFHPLAGCVIHLEQHPRSYGDARRKLRVVKSRGLASASGYHDMKIHTGEMKVFPRLDSFSQPERKEFPVLASGIPGLDELLGGGLEFGCTSLVVGPSGTGKSTIASVFATAGADAGKRGAIYLFDERPETFKIRATGAQVGLAQHVETGRILLKQLDPAEIGPGEFAQEVRAMLDEHRAEVVVIDSVAGYFNAIGSTEEFTAQLHELLIFLSRRGVLTILTAAQEGFMSIGQQFGVDISYLSDSILVLGFFEDDAAMHRFVVPVKKREGSHSNEVRELVISSEGVRVGQRLRNRGKIVLRTNERPAGTPGQ